MAGGEGACMGANQVEGQKGPPQHGKDFRLDLYSEGGRSSWK